MPLRPFTGDRDEDVRVVDCRGGTDQRLRALLTREPACREHDDVVRPRAELRPKLAAAIGEQSRTPFPVLDVDRVREHVHAIRARAARNDRVARQRPA